MAMSRSLGEGHIVKVLKNYAFIRDERLGQVYFPVTAANVTEKCSDLREKFCESQSVIFTAQRQQPPKNECSYIASSVVTREQLIDCVGKITEVQDKFCYCEVARYGRVFVPFSARSGLGRPWLGKGALVGGTLTLKIFPQPDIKTCRFVAFAISLNTMPVNGVDLAQKGGSHRAPDIVLAQYGCIVSFNPTSESLVYSSVTGLASLPSRYVEPFMELGSWIRYNAIKQRDDSTVVSTCASNGIMNGSSPLQPPPSGSPKAAWTVSSPVDLGLLYNVIPDEMDETRLQLDCHAVVNRVCKSTRSAWLWNDFIGRVYLPPLFWRAGLKPLDLVKIRVTYTGHFEDVPWSAIEVHSAASETGEQERKLCSQMLTTSDEWKVAFVQQSGTTFYCFLEHLSYGSAFAAWTDFADGEDPPTTGTRCRVTVYRQERDKKHVYRAVLVSPLDDSGDPIHHHPLMQSALPPNRLPPLLPEAWRAPLPMPDPPLYLNGGSESSAPTSRRASPPVAPLSCSFSAIAAQGTPAGLAAAAAAQAAAQAAAAASTASASPPPSTGSGSGYGLDEPLELFLGTVGGEVGATSLLTPNDFYLPQEHHDDQPSPPTPSPSTTSTSLTATSALGGAPGDFPPMLLNGAAARFAFNGFNEEAWWKPLVPAENLAPGYRGPSLGTAPSEGGSVTRECADAETQTEQMNEQRVMRDIINNSALLVKIFEIFPQHVESIMQISKLLPFQR